MAAQIYGQWTERVLESFVLYTASGDKPRGPLIQGNDGALYGLTSDGGTGFGGTIFKINCDGSGFTVLYPFHTYQDGWMPQGGLVQGRDGALYGTTWAGGSNGQGTVFKINPDGSDYTFLHEFPANAVDGARPNDTLVQGRDGALYGTTGHGGTNDQGTVFKINPDGGGYIVLHSFAADDGYGISPDAGVIQASDGVLYGATPEAGTNGSGTVYKLNPDGSGYAVIHTFGASGDGMLPYCALVQGADGALYGTTWEGGAHHQGTVFKLNLDGTGYVSLYSFNESGPDPHTPEAGLVQGARGYLYGTGYGGAASGAGAVFTIRTNGTAYAVLHTFPVDNYDGNSPCAALIEGKDGALYGTTLFGGTNGYGTVFRLAPPAPPQLGSPRVLSDGSICFSLIAPAGQSCRIDISTNLINWTALTNITSGTNAVQIIDSSAMNSTRRFYRAACSR